ncbi:MAG: MerR family transcriptional regulator, partial [Alphaproteobacteria bacterium]
RNARYSDYHVKRLQTIRQLKDDHNLPLSEIRRLVTMAAPDEDIQIRLVPVRAAEEEVMQSPAEAPKEEENERSSALDYVRARRAAGRGRSKIEDALAASPDMPRSAEESGASSPGESPIEALLAKLRDGAGLGNVPRRAQGQEWVRLEVTPDIEIHLRGQLYGEQLKDFERLADLMRHILLGSEDHE